MGMGLRHAFLLFVSCRHLNLNMSKDDWWGRNAYCTLYSVQLYEYMVIMYSSVDGREWFDDTAWKAETKDAAEV